MTPPAATPAHFRRNFTSLAADGALYMGGMALVMPQTILPRVIESLDGPRWMIAMLPTVMTLGVLGPSLFVGHRIARMEHVRPLVVSMGLPQRIPYAITGFLLLLVANMVPGSALAALVLITPLVSGLAAGISLTAFQEFVARTVPSRHQPSLWAARNLGSALLGMACGQAVAVVLERWPGSTGFGVLHLGAFALMMVSFFVFLTTRETGLVAEHTRGELRWRDFIRSLPVFVRTDPQLRHYLISRFFAVGMQITLPFLSIHVLSSLGKPDSYLGFLVSVNMAGSIVGNLLGAWLGGKVGSRALVMASNVGYVMLCVWAPLAHSGVEFTAIYFLLGLSLAVDAIGVPALGFAVSPTANRVAYLTSMAAVTLVSILALSLLNIGLERVPRAFTYQSLASGLCVAVSLYSLWRIREPRTVSTPSAVA